jgi:hypothetical protein
VSNLSTNYKCNFNIPKNERNLFIYKFILYCTIFIPFLLHFHGFVFKLGFGCHGHIITLLLMLLFLLSTNAQSNKLQYDAFSFILVSLVLIDHSQHVCSFHDADMAHKIRLSPYNAFIQFLVLQNTTAMATYFHVALSGPARTWLMNLALGSVYTWEELCAWFIANFASAYQQHGVEAHLHAVRQEPGETLRTFISRFTKVRGTIPRISDASIIMAFRHGVHDKKMLEKLATHDVETVPMLFALADKCARAAKGRAWHLAPQTGTAQTGGSEST